MVQTLAAENVTLEQLILLYGLELVDSEEFFREWQDDLPELTSLEKQLLDQIKAGYINLRNYPPLLENTVNTIVLSPLLFIGKFYLPPFHLKLEKTIEIQTQDNQTIIKGRIDFLLLNQKFWVTVIESKQVAYSVEAGLDQILAYMLAAPQSQDVVFGMITSGGSFMFIKLLKGHPPRYATSDIFDVRNRGNELYDVLRILKGISELTENN
ncbi:restriction endonuclease subunit R [Desmonostoc muscorum LEGE 12446]|uniref:Restriction endonuclease subunit R n=1 Tax=Desmonostoc muscorum LEGE 12446 TaxID=1828758 RepID=A0A8J7AGI3_DESMC|nr:restriction endonuclease subunit R [Desmonostoc muscorum]MCF2150274.1 restriction endonuclease subunit R [Desmonostoc muscorum LEGE 12446]